MSNSDHWFYVIKEVDFPPLLTKSFSQEQKLNHVWFLLFMEVNRVTKFINIKYLYIAEISLRLSLQFLFYYASIIHLQVFHLALFLIYL